MQVQMLLISVLFCFGIFSRLSNCGSGQHGGLLANSPLQQPYRQTRFINVVKQYHDSEMKRDENRSYQLFELLIRRNYASARFMPGSKGRSRSDPYFWQEARLRYFNPKSAECRELTVSAIAGKYSSYPHSSPSTGRLPDLYLDLPSGSEGRDRKLIAPAKPLNEADGIWNLDMTDVLHMLSIEYGHRLPMKFDLSDDDTRSYHDEYEVYIRRQPRVFAGLSPQVSDPMPCTFEMHFGAPHMNEVLIGTHAMEDGKLRAREVVYTPEKLNNKHLIDRWPVWLKRQQGPIPAWHGELVENVPKGP